MGYDFHITRREHWSDDNSQINISLKEWESVVADDDELEMDESTSVSTNIGERKLYKWTKANSVNNPSCAWFDLDQGNIDVKDPDDQTIKKMKQIAQLLGAKVQGDDGEIYEF